MKEIWKTIPEFPGYLLSSEGKVYSEKSGKQLKCPKNGQGYPHCNLYVEGKASTKRVHKLMAEIFLQPAPGPKHVINHIDGDKTNNRIENLEWVTQKENIRHSFDNGLQVSLKGEAHGSSKLTKEQVMYIRENYKARDKEFGGVPLSKKFGVHKQTISDIIHYKIWKEI